MLRGSPISTVLPVVASMLATVIESVRRPQRPGPGVAADEQHVVATVVLAGHGVAGEHGQDEVALYADQVRAEEQRAGDREAQHAVQADHRPPVASDSDSG